MIHVKRISCGLGFFGGIGLLAIYCPIIPILVASLALTYMYGDRIFTEVFKK